MKISVIIRTYNRGYIVGEAIRSATEQTYRNLEVLVVDNASTDNTSEVVAAVDDCRIRYVAHSSNRGLGASCNTGVSMATGDLVAFLDSDDLWTSDKLERQASILIRHPEIGAVFSDVVVQGTPTPIPSLTRLMKYFRELVDHLPPQAYYLLPRRTMHLCLLQELPIKPSALIVRRCLFEGVGTFNEMWQSGEDWEFLLRLARAVDFAYIDVPLAVQRHLPDSTHRAYWECDKLSLIEMLIQEKRTLQHDREGFKAAKKGIRRQSRMLGRYYRWLGDKEKATATYLRGFVETLAPEMLDNAVRIIGEIEDPLFHG